jgi:hypothetical protein
METIDAELGVSNAFDLDMKSNQDIDGVGKQVLNKVQETFDLVVPEAETLLKNTLDSGKRLDSKPKVVGGVSNSLLVYGGLAVILYFLLRK